MASRSVNKVILIGHLGKNAETKFTPSGAAATRFSVATSAPVERQTIGRVEGRDQLVECRSLAVGKAGGFFGQRQASVRGRPHPNAQLRKRRAEGLRHRSGSRRSSIVGRPGRPQRGGWKRSGAGCCCGQWSGKGRASAATAVVEEQYGGIDDSDIPF